MSLHGQQITVLGAGMVGTCTALALLRQGAKVRLIDRKPPGSETSYGNAGVLARSSLVPLNNPGLLRDLPGLLRNRRGGFRYEAGFVWRNMNWAVPFLANARPAKARRSMEALDALIRHSTPRHRDLIAEAGQGDLLVEKGWLWLYRRAAQAEGAGAALAPFDVATEALDAAALQELEPGLRQIFPRALWIKDAASVRDPGGLVKAYARLFAAEGGVVEQADVAELDLDGPALRFSDGRCLVSDHLTLCPGPWGRVLLERAGYSVRMAYERGYHRHFTGMGGNAGLSRPVYDTAAGYVLAPMRQGLRLTTGVELAQQDAPSNPAQIEHAERYARQAITLGDRIEAAPWRGARPTFPDSRPCIGPLPGAARVTVAFGHQHIGFATAPGTADLLAALVSGTKPPLDPRPFRPERYIRRQR